MYDINLFTTCVLNILHVESHNSECSLYGISRFTTAITDRTHPYHNGILVHQLC